VSKETIVWFAIGAALGYFVLGHYFESGGKVA
jgi:hypothetical protein